MYIRSRMRKLTDTMWTTSGTTWPPHGVSCPQGDGYNVDNGKVTWHPHSLSSPKEISKGNILRFTVNPDQQSVIWKRSRKISAFMWIFLIRKNSPSPRKKKSQFYTTIEAPKHLLSWAYEDYVTYWRFSALSLCIWYYY